MFASLWVFSPGRTPAAHQKFLLLARQPERNASPSKAQNISPRFKRRDIVFLSVYQIINIPVLSLFGLDSWSCPGMLEDGSKGKLYSLQRLPGSPEVTQTYTTLALLQWIPENLPQLFWKSQGEARTKPMSKQLSSYTTFPQFGCSSDMLRWWLLNLS